MKKRMLIGVATVAMLCVTAVICLYARSRSSTPTQVTAAPFTLRNGITWGMSPDEVDAREGSQRYERIWDAANGLTGWQYSGQKVSQYEGATLDYVFRNGGLCTAYYLLNTPNAAEYSYLNGALQSEYGPGVNTSPLEVVALMDWLSAGPAPAANTITNCRMWQVGDTQIRLAIYGSVHIMIFYTPVNYQSITGQ